MKHFRDGDGVIHCDGLAGDYMLCGQAPEGGDFTGSCVETSAIINCRQCIAIIEFCQKIRAGEWFSSKRNQR